jgi:polyisoprenoid-binding protein YceI
MNNSKYIFVTLISLIVAIHSVSYARKTFFEVDQKESKVGFMVKHKITKDVYGGFRNVEGNVTFDKEENSIVSVEAKIDVNSIDTGNSKRDRHLKSPDFFDANNFPFISFVSSDVKKLENGKYIVTGLLTMRGITKNITLRGERKININNNMVFSAESLIDRQDFEISWNRPFQKIAGMMVSNEVKILLNIKVKEI